MKRGSRPGAALLLCGALLIVPLLLIHGDPEASASAPGTAPDRHGAPGPPRHPSGWKLASGTRAAPTTPAAPPGGGATTLTPTDPGSSSPPASEQASATGEEVARRVATATTTTSPPPTTTTTSAPVGMVASGSLHYGQVTYYDHPAGTCASPWLPFGTVVEVLNPVNGYSVSCVVNDREADTARSIDLATSTFAAIAPLSQGVIDAQLRW